MQFDDYANFEDKFFQLDLNTYEDVKNYIDSMLNPQTKDYFMNLILDVALNTVKNKQLYIDLKANYMGTSRIDSLDNILIDYNLYSSFLHDDLNIFLDITSSSNTVNDSVYFTQNYKVLDYLSISSLFGAATIFKYILSNNIEIHEKAVFCAIQGGNPEIIEICATSDIDLSNFIDEAIKMHNNDIAYFILNEYGIKDLTKSMICCINHFNTSFFRILVEWDLDHDKNITNDCATVLCRAIDRDRNDIVKFLLNKGAKVSKSLVYDNTYIRYNGVSPITEAVRKDNFEVVEWLLSKGADVNESCKYLQTPLFVCRSGKMVELLVKNGADVNKIDFGNDSALSYSIQHDFLDVSVSLINHGADVSCLNSKFGDIRGNICKIIEIFDIKFDNQEIECDISAAHDLYVSTLIERNALVDNISLVKVIEEQMVKTFKSLLGKVKLTKLDSQRRLPIHHAAMYSSDILRLLLEYDRSAIDAKDVFGKTPLHYAAAYDVECAKILIEFSCDINPLDNKGNTPLICAAQKQNMESVSYLLEKNANPEIKNKGGRNYQSFLKHN